MTLQEKMRVVIKKHGFCEFTGPGLLLECLPHAGGASELLMAVFDELHEMEKAGLVISTTDDGTFDGGPYYRAIDPLEALART